MENKQLHVLHLMPNLQKGTSDLETVVAVSKYVFLKFVLKQKLSKLHNLLRESGDINNFMTRSVPVGGSVPSEGVNIQNDSQIYFKVDAEEEHVSGCDTQVL